MRRKLLFLVLALGLCLTSSTYASTIIWVSDNKNYSGGDAADQGWVDLLRAQGYTVDYRGEEGSGSPDYRYWRELDSGKIAELNAADLIIVSRDISSGGYDDGQEPTQWSSVTAPLILQIAHLVRSADWNWLNSSSTSSTTANMVAVLPNHYVFAGVTLDASKQVNILASGDADVGAVTDAGNGTVIGTRADTGAVWIAEWEPGVEFYAGAGLYTGGPRMWFAGGGVPDGLYNFNAEGEKLFLNAVKYMLGDIGDPALASNPSPAHEATDVPRDMNLSWMPGEFVPAVNGHKIFLSDNFNDVNEGLATAERGTLSNPEFDTATLPIALEFSTTYYWRVDEVNSVSGWDQGDVWQFTVEPFSYPVENITATASSQFSADEGPENTINSSGLDANDLHSDDSKAMWLSSVIDPNVAWIQYELDQVYKLHQMLVWNHNSSVEPIIGFGIKEAAIEYSTDGANWTTLGTTHEFARAPGAVGYAPNTTVDLSGVVAKYVKITANSNWGGMVTQYGLSEVRFFYIPVLARELNPASGSTDMGVNNVTLSWRAGREAASHEVYFSDSNQAVIDGTALVATVSKASYDTGELELGQTYYWKVNEVNEAGTPITWQGDVSNFTTREFLVVDDFEDYNDFEPDRIFDTWIDGWADPTKGGSQVGYNVAPFAEQTIVRSGQQSMPLIYDNSTAGYSEATANVANLPIGQDWTKYGIKALTLFFYGDPTNAAGQMYVKLNGSKVVYDGDAADIAKPLWKRWNIDLASFGVNPAPVAGVGVNLQSVTKLSIGIDGIGVSGTLYFDDIGLYSVVPEPSDEVFLEAEAADIMGASWRIYDDPTSSGGKHIGSEDGDGNDGDTAPGAEWVAVYNFTAPAAGVYTVVLRVQDAGSDSFWVRIPSATSQTHEDPDQPGTGWVLNDISSPEGVWEWEKVKSDDHGDAVVSWTLPAGAHTLEIAKREDGVYLDSILITK